MEPQSVAHTSQPSLFSVSLPFLSHLFHFSYISNFRCWAGLGLSASFLWTLCHSYFPCILYLSILPAEVLMEKVGTLLSNWFPHIHIYSQSCLQSTTKTPPQSILCVVFINVCLLSSELLFYFFLLISEFFLRQMGDKNEVLLFHPVHVSVR